MSTKYIDIIRSEGGETVLIARCVWREGSPVEVHGEGSFAVELQFGVEDMEGTTRMPEDGGAFLNAVRFAFRTPYLLATSVQEGEPPEAVFG